MTISRAVATALPTVEARTQASLDMLAVLDQRVLRNGRLSAEVERLAAELRRFGVTLNLERRVSSKSRHKRGDCTRCGCDRQIHHVDGGVELCAACWQRDPASHRTCRRCGVHEYLSYFELCRACRAVDRLAGVFPPERLAAHPELRGVYRRLREDRRYLASGVLNRGPAKLLRRFVAGGCISHDALDLLGTSGQTRVVRAFLVEGGVLPPRDDRLHALERWIERTAKDVPDADRIAFIRFARWRSLRAARTDAMTDGQAAGKRRELAMVRDLLHAVAADGRSLRNMRQPQLDSWLYGHPAAARPITSFIRWCKATGINVALAVPAFRQNPRPPGPALTEHQRLEQLAAILDPEVDIAPELRLAAGLVILYAARPHHLASLPKSAIIVRPGATFIAIGRDPLLLPEPLDRYALDTVQAKVVPRFGGPTVESHWLFPSPIAGRHLQPSSLSARLRRVGIQPSAARKTAVADLAVRLPPAVVSRLIGVQPRTATRWGAAVSQSQALYAAEIAPQG